MHGQVGKTSTADGSESCPTSDLVLLACEYTQLWLRDEESGPNRNDRGLVGFHGAVHMSRASAVSQAYSRKVSPSLLLARLYTYPHIPQYIHFLCYIKH